VSDVRKSANCVKNATHYSPPIARIAALVAAEFGLSADELRSRNCPKALARPRHIAMWLGRQIGCTYAGMGRYFNNRDHRTAMYGHETIDINRETDPQLRDRTDRLLAIARNLPPPPRLPVVEPLLALPPKRRSPDADEDWEAFAIQDAAFRRAFLRSGEVCT
jgi:hypothetical protein